jgi:hypothetical protein
MDNPLETNTNCVFLIERKSEENVILMPELGIFTSKSFALEALILALEPLVDNLDEFRPYIKQFKADLKQAVSFSDVNEAISNMCFFGYKDSIELELRKNTNKPWVYSFICLNRLPSYFSPVVYATREIQLNEFLDPWKNYKPI